jgi:hypothetical protein
MVLVPAVAVAKQIGKIGVKMAVSLTKGSHGSVGSGSINRFTNTGIAIVDRRHGNLRCWGLKSPRLSVRAGFNPVLTLLS